MWKVTVHPAAVQDMQWLKENKPCAFESICATLDQLAKMRDPRQHKHVKEILYDAPGWWRLAIYEHRIRVVFRLLQKIDGVIVEVEEITDHVPSALQVCRAGLRSEKTYGKMLRQRQEKVRNWK